MKRTLFTVFAVLTLALVACDDGDGNGPTQPVINPPDDPSSGVVQPAITSSSQYKWSIPDTAPAVNTNCDAPDTGIYGAYVEWKGFVHDGTTYSCNACPGGRELWQGTWRAQAADYDPVTPFEEPGYAERLIFNGNLWTMDINSDVDGQHRFKGFYWCGQKPEVNNETVMFVFTEVSQEGAFGWYTGGAFSVSVLEGSTTVNTLATFWKDGVDTNFTGKGDFSATYCRVGSTVTNDEGVSNACNDPFQ